MTPERRGTAVRTRHTLYIAAAISASILAACGQRASTQDVINRAHKNLAAHNYRAAAVDLENLLSVRPEDAEIRLELAQARLRTGRYAEAEAAFHSAQQLGAKDTVVRPGLTETLLSEGRPQEVLDEIAKQPAYEPLDAELLSLRGRALMALTRLDEARASFDQALNLNPADTRARIARATLLESQGDAAGAKEDLLKAVSLAAPDDFSARLALGTWYRNQRQGQEAKVELSKALDIAIAGIRAGSEPPRDEVRVLAMLGDADLLLNDVASAQQREDRMKKLAPHDSVTLLLQARIYLAQKRVDETRTVLEELLSRDPSNEQAKVLAGAADASAGKLEQAAMYLSSALAQAPGDVSARRLLAQVQLQQHLPEEALKTASGPNAAADPDLLLLAGRASAMTGDLTGATQFLERSEQAAPQEKTRALAVAAAYLSTNRAPEAVKLLQELEVPDALASRREWLLLQALLKSGPHADVKAEAIRFVQSRPRDQQAMLVAERGLWLADDAADARGLIDKAAQLDPHSTGPWLALAALEWSQKNASAADAALKHALQLDPHDAGALMDEAQIAYTQGDLKTAIRYLEQARSVAASSLQPRVILARLYLVQGQASSAASVLAEARKIAPDDFDVQLLDGTMTLTQGNAAQAIDDFQKLVARAPRSAPMRTNLARAYILGHRPDDAHAALDEALKMEPTYWPAIALQTSLALDQPDLKVAEASMQSLRASKAPRSVVSYNEGDLAARKGDFAAALKGYTEAAGLSPSSALTLKITAMRHLLHIADPDAPLREWLQHAPGDVPVRLVLAEDMEKQGDTSGAAAQYEALLTSAPKQVIALNNLAWIKLQTGQYPVGLDLAKRAYDIAGGNPAVADTYGWALEQSGRGADALQVLRKASSSDPKNNSIRLHLAVTELKQGEKADARRDLQALVDAHLQGSEGEQARTLLRGLDGS
jgi:putative PEP-CTERM system TPR-repeat lipoprotein